MISKTLGSRGHQCSFLWWPQGVVGDCLSRLTLLILLFGTHNSKWRPLSHLLQLCRINQLQPTQQHQFGLVNWPLLWVYISSHGWRGGSKRWHLLRSTDRWFHRSPRNPWSVVTTHDSRAAHRVQTVQQDPCSSFIHWPSVFKHIQLKSPVTIGSHHQDTIGGHQTQGSVSRIHCSIGGRSSKTKCHRQNVCQTCRARVNYKYIC